MLLLILYNYIFICIVSAETVTQVNGTAVAQPIESPSSHDLQIYGIVVTILLCFIVFGGVKMINRVAPAFLIPVLFSLICIFLGVLLARKDHPTGLFFALSPFTNFPPLNFPFAITSLLKEAIF